MDEGVCNFQAWRTISFDAMSSRWGKAFAFCKRLSRSGGLSFEEECNPGWNPPQPFFIMEDLDARSSRRRQAYVILSLDRTLLRRKVLQIEKGWHWANTFLNLEDFLSKKSAIQAGIHHNLSSSWRTRHPDPPDLDAKSRRHRSGFERSRGNKAPNSRARCGT